MTDLSILPGLMWNDGITLESSGGGTPPAPLASLEDSNAVLMQDSNGVQLLDSNG